jgi:threonine dehydrogenase-like Zn-dependent dehydrogenase
MITHHVGLDELPEMMEKLLRGSLDAVKVIVRP